MDKQTKLKIALPLLILVMVFVWGPVIMGGGSKKKAKDAKSVSSGSTSKGSSADLMALSRSSERKKARTSYKEWGRHSFTPSESPKASVLEGIMWDEKAPKAIINGYILGVGEQFGSGEIIDIQPTSVTIKTGTAEKVYSLGE